MGKTKFSTWFKAFKKVVLDIETVVLTDTELWQYVNGQLPPRDRVAYSTFEKWKQPTSPKNVDHIEGISKEEAEEFKHLLGYSRVRQKIDLTKTMLDPENKAAYKQQWILERKFEDMKQQPQIQLNSNPTIQIQAGSKEQAALIDNLMNGEEETIDIDHEEEQRKRLEQ